MAYIDYTASHFIQLRAGTKNIYEANGIASLLPVSNEWTLTDLGIVSSDEQRCRVKINLDANSFALVIDPDAPPYPLIGLQTSQTTIG